VAQRDDSALLREVGLLDPPPASEGLFRKGCWLRRVSAEPVLLFGGGRALLLEVAHPLVAAGVAEHSDFEREPFGRLQRTLDAVSAIVFADRGVALDAARAVAAAHLRVRGTLARDAGPFLAGTPYSGRDPELLRWVWASLLDTALVVYQRFVDALPPAALADYYADQRVLGQLLGIPEPMLPPGIEEFRRYFADMLESDAVSITQQGRAIARAVLSPERGYPGQGRVADLTAALLPAKLREGFELPWDVERARRVEAMAMSVRALRRRSAASEPLDGQGEPR